MDIRRFKAERNDFRVPRVIKMGAPITPRDAPEEARLVRLAKEGDMSAFEGLVRTYERPIYALCRRFTGDHASADDLAQDTFIKAWFAFARFDETQPLYPWLRRIAVNASLNAVRDRRRTTSLDARPGDSGPAAEPGPGDPEAAAEGADLERRFRAALSTLPVEQRAVFVLRHDEGLGYEEIAATLELPVGTVMSRLNRARERLQALLADVLRRRS
jgi:RNA polymerase sigma-70 factor (ECF subfamily)